MHPTIAPGPLAYRLRWLDQRHPCSEVARSFSVRSYEMRGSGVKKRFSEEQIIGFLRGGRVGIRGEGTVPPAWLPWRGFRLGLPSNLSCWPATAADGHPVARCRHRPLWHARSPRWQPRGPVDESRHFRRRAALSPHWPHRPNRPCDVVHMHAKVWVESLDPGGRYHDRSSSNMQLWKARRPHARRAGTGLDLPLPRMPEAHG